jgi:hypothetical protein
MLLQFVVGAAACICNIALPGLFLTRCTTVLSRLTKIKGQAGDRG